ncbi:MAG: gamma-glutamyl-gamma-aminobutyrate hydrolase family protein [Rhizobiaceae bacterium]|nr:gamma-glutamyl-gamma-aminobutyrate hydrolase family protein [Rhizobiaceae bacterium]
MGKPVVGIIGNEYRIEDRFQVQTTGQANMTAVVQVCDALPLIFAGSSHLTDIGALLNAVDGIVLTGARANVHPANFDTEPHEAYEPYDENRDQLALELARACLDKGVPLFGICRGMQEMNVAFGGSLHPEIRDIPGRMNHRMPRLQNGEIHPDPEVIFADRHDVKFTKAGEFERIYGKPSIRVNSLHGQGVLEKGDRINIGNYSATLFLLPLGATI